MAINLAMKPRIDFGKIFSFFDRLKYICSHLITTNFDNGEVYVFANMNVSFTISMPLLLVIDKLPFSLCTTRM